MDAAAGNSVLGGNDRINSGLACLDRVVGNQLLQNDLVDIQGAYHVDDRSSVVSLRSDISDNHISDISGNLYVDNERAADGSDSRKVTLSDGLKNKLNEAENEARKTLIIQEDLTRLAEEKEKQTEIQIEDAEVVRKLVMG